MLLRKLQVLRRVVLHMGALVSVKGEQSCVRIGLIRPMVNRMTADDLITILAVLWGGAGLVVWPSCLQPRPRLNSSCPVWIVNRRCFEPSGLSGQRSGRLAYCLFAHWSQSRKIVSLRPGSPAWGILTVHNIIHLINEGRNLRDSLVNKSL